MFFHESALTFRTQYIEIISQDLVVLHLYLHLFIYIQKSKINNDCIKLGKVCPNNEKDYYYGM